MSIYNIVRYYLGDLEKHRYTRCLMKQEGQIVFKRHIGRVLPAPADEDVVEDEYFVQLGELFYIYNTPYVSTENEPEELHEVDEIIINREFYDTTQRTEKYLEGIIEDKKLTFRDTLPARWKDMAERAVSGYEPSESLVYLIERVTKYADVFSIEKDGTCTFFSKEAHGVYEPVQKRMLKVDVDMGDFDKIICFESDGIYTLDDKVMIWGL